MKTSELRKKFLDYFKNQGHTVVPSSPVVPLSDPTLLFTNAGMNQFKDVFLGKTKLPYTKAASSQKCVRVGGKHNDFDNVGHTSRHLTFFEMLGNFSFGDYFKKEAIRFAFEVTTKIFAIEFDRVWATVFETDDESFELWKEYLPESKIVRMGAKDNFWAMGETGPCGPCSELYFDRGDGFGPGTSPANDPTGERFFEFWNLVFMQYNKDTSGKENLLPSPSIDTGMGLERLSSLKIDGSSVFEIDIFQNLFHAIEELSKVKYATNKAAFHVIADHIRTLSFGIADGAQPSNVDRGYVLRKILRRATRYARQIGLEKPFMADLLPALIKEMGEDYKELVTAEKRIKEILTLEEENFLKTLSRGGNILNTIIDKAKESQTKQITGEDAFKLKDTYGFPLEEIMILAKDNHLEVNLEAYSLLENKAKELSRKSAIKHHQIAEESLFAEFLQNHSPSSFVGYTHLETKGSIIGILVGGKFVDKLEEGIEASLILDQTSFYAEMGGQVGDKGEITHETASFRVLDTISPYPGVILHQGSLQKGVLILGEPVFCKVDEKERRSICHNHTATHLLHHALEIILCSSVKQTGSLVEKDRLRFDFSYHKPLSGEEIRQIEMMINEEIQKNFSVTTFETSYESIKVRKDIKQYFGDKYGENVRVVNIGEFSKELCGGTHVDSLAEIGLFRIVKESSIAAGVRRIEAVTGKEALAYMYSQEKLLEELQDHLEANPANIKDKLLATFSELTKCKELLKKMRKAHIKMMEERLLAKKEFVGGIPIIIDQVELFKEELAPLAHDLLLELKSGILILALIDTDKCQILIRVSEDLISQGIKANELVREIAPFIGGSGGGKPDSAQAGGKEIENLEKAFSRARELLANR